MPLRSGRARRQPPRATAGHAPGSPTMSTWAGAWSTGSHSGRQPDEHQLRPPGRASDHLRRVPDDHRRAGEDRQRLPLRSRARRNIGLLSADMRKQLREEPCRTGRWPRGSGARRSSHDPQLQHARRGQPSGATGLNPTPQPSIPHRRPPQPSAPQRRPPQPSIPQPSAPAAVGPRSRRPLNVGPAAVDPAAVGPAAVGPAAVDPAAGA